MKRLNTYPLKNGTLLVATADKPVRVKYHSLCGHFAIIPIMIERDRFTAADEAKGKKNEKRAYQLTHIPSGRRLAIYNTIRKAQSFYSAVQNTANRLGLDLDSLPDSKDEKWKDFEVYCRKYILGLVDDNPVKKSRIVNEYPTRVEEKDDKQ